MNTSTTSTPAPSIQQAAIIDEVTNGTGNLIVQAYAGSGKTSLLAMVCNAIPRSKRVVALAFNKKNAEEFSHRLRPGVDSCTLNSFGNRVVRSHWPNARPKPSAERNRCLHVLGEEYKYAATTLAKLVGLCKGWLVDVENDQEIIAIARRYDVFPDAYLRITPTQWAGFVREVLAISLDESLASQWGISFDDQLWLPVVLGWSVPEFDWVLVDETQDLNPCQVQLVLKMIAAQGGRCLAVGDQNQAIYAFRGADTRSMSRLKTALAAVEYPLSVSYRCGRAIIAEAQSLVPGIEAAPNAAEGIVEHDETVEYLLASAQCGGKEVVDGKVVTRDGDWVVSRKNAPLVSLCMKLMRMGKTAKIMGRKDSSAEFSTLIRKSRATTVPSLASWLAGFEKKERERLTKAGQEDKIEAVVDRIETLHALCEGLDTVAQVEARMIQLFADDALANAIVLSSTHKAKGMEADTVFLLEDTFRPGANEEESNLLYVGITRAKRRLVYVHGADKKRAAKREE